MITFIYKSIKCTLIYSDQKQICGYVRSSYLVDCLGGGITNGPKEILAGEGYVHSRLGVGN